MLKKKKGGLETGEKMDKTAHILSFPQFSVFLLKMCRLSWGTKEKNTPRKVYFILKGKINNYKKGGKDKA